jgi:hypothetical protein
MYFNYEIKSAVVIDKADLIEFQKFALEKGLSFQVVDSAEAASALNELSYELQNEYNESYEESWESSGPC